MIKAIVQTRPLGIKQIRSIILEHLGIDTVDSPGPNKFGEIFFKNCELARIMSQVFFEMNLYVMILVKIGVIHRNLFGGTLFLQPTHATRQRVRGGFIP